MAHNVRDALDPLQVCRDDQCELWRWIYGEASRRFHALEGFRRLRITHADFHQAAARAVALAQQGQDEAAREEIAHGEFARTSVRIKSELAKLYLDLGTD